MPRQADARASLRLGRLELRCQSNEQQGARLHLTVVLRSGKKTLVVTVHEEEATRARDVRLSGTNKKLVNEREGDRVTKTDQFRLREDLVTDELPHSCDPMVRIEKHALGSDAVHGLLLVERRTGDDELSEAEAQ